MDKWKSVKKTKGKQHAKKETHSQGEGQQVLARRTFERIKEAHDQLMGLAACGDSQNSDTAKNIGKHLRGLFLKARAQATTRSPIVVQDPSPLSKPIGAYSPQCVVLGDGSCGLMCLAAPLQSETQRSLLWPESYNIVPLLRTAHEVEW